MPVARRPSRPEAWVLAGTATLTMAVSYLDRQTMAVLAPSMTTALGISETEYGWLVSAFSVAYLVGATPAGLLVDRVGARRGLPAAVLAWSAVAAAHALAPGLGALFALRILLGLAEAPSLPGAAQTIQRALPPAERARGFGLLFAGSSLGGMVAPPLATWIAAHHGWRAAFVGTALVGLAWVPLWLAVAWRGRARAALDSPADAPAAAAASRLELLRQPAVLRGVAVILACAPALAFAAGWGAKYLVDALHLTPEEVGGYLWLPPLLYDAGAIAFGHLASRGAPPRPLLGAAAALCCFGALATPFAGGPWRATLLAGLCLAGGGGLYALATADMLARVPRNAVSTAGGLIAAAQSLAYVVASPLIGRAVDALGSYTWIFIAVGLWVLPGCVAWLAWEPVTRES